MRWIGSNNGIFVANKLPIWYTAKIRLETVNILLLHYKPMNYE